VKIDGRPLLLVQWHDAASFHMGWEKLDVIAKQQPPVVRSVGWLLKRTKRHLTLVASIVGDEGSSDVTIPTGWIISEKELA
jgi:hypothetical protein